MEHDHSKTTTFDNGGKRIRALDFDYNYYLGM